eukprot:gene11691-34416_t
MPADLERSVEIAIIELHRLTSQLHNVQGKYNTLESNNRRLKDYHYQLLSEAGAIAVVGARPPTYDYSKGQLSPSEILELKKKGFDNSPGMQTPSKTLHLGLDRTPLRDPHMARSPSLEELMIDLGGPGHPSSNPHPVHRQASFIGGDIHPPWLNPGPINSNVRRSQQSQSHLERTVIAPEGQHNYAPHKGEPGAAGGPPPHAQALVQDWMIGTACPPFNGTSRGESDGKIPHGSKEEVKTEHTSALDSCPQYGQQQERPHSFPLPGGNSNVIYTYFLSQVIYTYFLSQVIYTYFLSQ